MTAARRRLRDHRSNRNRQRSRFLAHACAVWEVSESLLASANYLFDAGYGSGDLGHAEQCATEARSAAWKVPNPAVIARASLLLARIAERRGSEDLTRLYEEASELAYDSASQELVGLARGETGLYFWERLPRTWEGDPKSLDRRRVIEELWRCVRPLAEAYRVHVGQRNYRALKSIAGNLGDALDMLQDGTRGLRAYCAVLYTSMQTHDTSTQRLAEERARDSVRQLLPDIDVAALEGEGLVEAILARLETVPYSQI